MPTRIVKPKNKKYEDPQIVPRYQAMSTWKDKQRKRGKL